MLTRIFACLALSATALAAGSGAFAKPTARSFESYAQVGFDTEMGSRQLRWLMPHFDADQLEKAVRGSADNKDKLTADVLEDYVLQKDAFDSLPAKLREKLSQGLDLENRGQVLRSQPAGLLDASGNALGGDRPKILLPDSAPPSFPDLKSSSVILRPDAKPATLEMPKLILPEDMAPTSRSDWAVLNARWQALPLAEKQAAVRVKHLSPDKAAELVMSLQVPATDPDALREYLRPKASAPAWLKKFDIYFDVSAAGNPPIEFALKGPERNINAAFEAAQALFRETKTEQIRANPHKQLRTDTAFHLHIGLRPGAPPAMEKKMEELLKSYRRLLLARLLQAGPQNDVIAMPGKTTRSRVAFDNELGERGLVRRVEPGHVEIRELAAHPRETFTEFAELMDLDLPEAHARINREISAIAKSDSTVLRRIAALNPTAFLTEFADVAPAEDYETAARAFARKVDAAKTLRAYLQKHPDEKSYRMLKAVVAAADNPADFDSPYMYQPFEKNEGLKAAIARDLLADPARNPHALNATLAWTKDKDPRFELLKKAEGTEEKIKLLMALDQGYGRENLLRFAPKFQASRNDLADALMALYGQKKAYGPDFLLADDLFKNIAGRSPLKATNFDELLNAAFWRKDLSARIAYEHLGQKLNSRYFTSLYSARLAGRLGAHVADIQKYPAENRAEALESFREVARKIGPIPDEFLAELKALKTNAEPALAQHVDHIIDAFSTPAAARAIAPTSCAAGFARLATQAVR